MPNLSDYKILDFFMNHVELEIDLTKKPVESTAKITITPNSNCKEKSNDLVLDGQNMKLKSIFMDGRPLNNGEFEVTDTSLIIKNIPQDRPFTLESTTQLGENTDLFGLYETEGTVLVKAETEGLRRVFYCKDRPDNLASYQTTIIAQYKKYPVLLSNGSIIKREERENGIHSVTWLDRVPKPSYLFALVAGKLQYSETFFTTQSGRELPIRFFVPSDATKKCDLAKEILKSAMRWEEHAFGLECELTQQMVAGVDKYASGASEPPGLILFNTENLYATAASKTDLGVLRIAEVVAHEYLHYRSGDRVTIRDWFNLALKEGLTTFRAAMFLESLFGTDLIRLLIGKNFDSRAPRQSSYTAVRSLYTAAAYEKSADIFRMMMISVGEKQFYKSLTQFFLDNDGGAVTLEHLMESVSKSSGQNVMNFLPWFTEDGIPTVTVTDEYIPDMKRYILKVKTKDAKNRPIPLVLGLLNKSGKEVKADTLAMINESEMEFYFDGIEERPIPSLLRSFSAPVHLDYEYSISDLLTLIKSDTNIYNRCEAMKKLIAKMIKEFCASGTLKISDDFVSAFRAVLNDKSLSNWLKADILSIPSEEELIEGIKKPNFEKIAQARYTIVHRLATSLKDDLEVIYQTLKNTKETQNPQLPEFDIKDAGNRRMIQVCYSYLQKIEPEATTKKLISEFNVSLGVNMTNTIGALTLLTTVDNQSAETALNTFYQFWKEDVGTINYWFKIQAAAHSTNVVAKVRNLLKHSDFDFYNPNRVYALLGTFIMNPYGFHASNGSGYQLMTECILELDKMNPAVAARLTEAFVNWDNFDDIRGQLMLNNLKLINEKAVSADVRTIAKKGLDKARGSSPLPIKQTFLSPPKESETKTGVMDAASIDLSP